MDPALQQLIDALRESSRAQIAQETAVREMRREGREHHAEVLERLEAMQSQVASIVREMDITNTIRKSSQEQASKVLRTVAAAGQSKPALVLYFILIYVFLQVLGFREQARDIRAFLGLGTTHESSHP